MGYSTAMSRQGSSMRRTGYQRGQSRGSDNRSGRGRVRIVAGRFRGRRIPVPPLPGLRPTPGRTRETLFNWLQGRIEGARVLDLFAGSGALGFEALSRGAASVVLVERDRRAHRILTGVASELDPVHCKVVLGDALRYPARPVEPFDLVFVDPPFGAGITTAVLGHLLRAGLLTRGAWVYCEASATGPAPWADPEAGCWEVLKETRAGDSRGALLTPGRASAGPV